MAMTPKIITSSTPLAASLMVAMVLVAVWLVAEYAPGANLVQPAEIEVEPLPPPKPSTAPRAELDVPFSPDLSPADPSWCAETADDVFEIFEPLTRGVEVEIRTQLLAATIGDYIRGNCPNAIHEGDWHVTAQILGVGIIYEALEPQSHVYVESITWDPRGRHLVGVATSTFEVLSPEALCDVALRQSPTGPNAFTPLVDRCLNSFQVR